MLILQHALTRGIIRVRAPLDVSVTQAVKDVLEQGSWLTKLSSTGLFVPVANIVSGGPVLYSSRLAWACIADPSQPDAQTAGLTVAHGAYIGQTDQFAADPLFVGYAGADIPTARATAVAYATGRPLVAGAFEALVGGAGATTLVYGLTTAIPATEAAFAVAYVERAPADNNSLLQFAVF